LKLGDLWQTNADEIFFASNRSASGWPGRRLKPMLVSKRYEKTRSGATRETAHCKRTPPALPSRQNATPLAKWGTGRNACATERPRQGKRRRYPALHDLGHVI